MSSKPDVEFIIFLAIMLHKVLYKYNECTAVMLILSGNVEAQYRMCNADKETCKFETEKFDKI